MPLFNCANCFRCCTHFTKDWMGPYLSSASPWYSSRNESELEVFSKFATQIMIEGREYTVLKPINSRCPLWTYGEKNHCLMYEQRPTDCRLYPFLLKDGQLIIHLTCPDAVRFLQLLSAGNAEAILFYYDAQHIIKKASERYRRYLEWQTKDFRFYCVVQ